MGFFKNMGAKMGVGGIKIQLNIPSTQLRQNSIVEGTIAIQGGTVQQQVNSLVVELAKHWETQTDSDQEDSFGAGIMDSSSTSSSFSTGNTTTTHHRQVLLSQNVAGGFSVAPSQALEQKFQLQIPPNMELAGSSASEELKLEAFAKISAARDATSEVVVQIIESENTSKLRSTLRTKYTESSSVGSVSRGNETAIVISYNPPEELKDKIDKIRIQCLNVPEGLDVILVLDTQEHGLKDMFKAIAGKDKVEMPLRLSQQDLDAGGAALLSNVEAKIQELLAKIG